MKFGLQLTAIHDASTPPAQQIAEHRELVCTGAQLGFELMSCGQHFLGTELRYYQPIPYLANLATSVPEMRIATGIILLSMLNPVQVAEEVATLDALTSGRVTFGVAVGYSPREFAAFGVRREDRGRRFDEALGLIKKLWSGDEVTHEGEFFQLDGPVRPALLPVQRPRPRIWIGGQSPPAVKRAARNADAWYAPPFPTHESLRDLATIFREEREQAGLPPATELPVRREVIISSSKKTARNNAADRSRARYKTYLKWGLGDGGDLSSSGGGFAAADDAEAEGRFLLGTAGEVAEQLAQLRDQVGMTHLIFKPQWPGLPHVDAMKQLELLGTKVAPLLQDETTTLNRLEVRP
jgi:alkanesulfonate monooxygenase SsuD/methylene tetrahydromethanopterin reductase-like flavin-dependent oxidoreductase (luciferase family)